MAKREMVAGKKLPAGAKRIPDNNLPSDSELIAEAKKLRQARDKDAGKDVTVDEVTARLDGEQIIERARELNTSDAVLIRGEAKSQANDDDVPDELRGLVGDGADAATILDRGGAIVETLSKSSRPDPDRAGEGPVKQGAPGAGLKSSKKEFPKAGTMVMFHSAMRRGGQRDHAPVPAIVTGEFEGKLHMTVFERGKVRFVSGITDDKKAEEHYTLT